MKIVTAPEMQALDRCSIEEYGIPGIVLMENAGRGTVDFMLHELGPVRDRSVVLFAGPGNNGGDGLVMARYLHQLGALPTIFFLVDPERLRGDAATNYRIVKKLGLPFHVVSDNQALQQVETVILSLHGRQPVHSLVDALFGTGLARDLAGRFLGAADLLNSIRRRHGWPVVAVDIPSGLESDSGRVLGGAVQADLTVTYGLAKPGHFMHGGPLTGTLHIVDIGIPPEIVARAALPGELLGRDMEKLLHRRPMASHKGTYGHVLIIAGSEGKTGAAILSAHGALHSGAGLVTLAVPHALNPIFETSLPEAMTVPLPCSQTCFSGQDYDQIKELLQGKRAVVLGPGIGTDCATEELVLRLYEETELPMVVDADGLNILARHRDRTAEVAGPRILTPHPGEMARLTGLSTAEIQQNRLAAARWLYERNRKGNGPEIITVLKGAGTVVTAADGRWAINASGNAGMATGGMGDVLSGFIGGLLVQGYPTWSAATLGVYLHGKAADLLARKTACGYLSSEVAAMLPAAMAACEDEAEAAITDQS